MRAAAILRLASLVAAQPVAAADPATWRVDPAASAITFTYVVDGEPSEGQFTEVGGEGSFEPGAPENARLTLEIPVDSLDLGSAIVTGLALGPDWFDAGNHPTARYRLARLTELAGDRYEALGDLTIKGTTQILRTPVSLDLTAERAHATGELTVDRRDFGLGVGISELFVTIGSEVTVGFDIIARPVE